MAPENTLASFTAALEAGLDGLETDLQRAADGALVVNHDPYLDHDDPVGTFIARLDLAEVRRQRPDVPTLADLRHLLEQRPAAVVNLELKTDAQFGDGRVQELAAELTAWPANVTRRLWISTFDPLQLLRLAEVGVPVPLAFLAFHASALALLPSLPVRAVHPHHSLVTPERVIEWRASGLAVFVWTVNDGALAERLLALRVDGLIGDHPALLLAARR